MADLKTKPTDTPVSDLLNGITDPARREDCERVIALMRRVTGEEPRIWGTGLVGFGTYHYKYESGREADWPLAGFASRKESLTVYVMAGVERFPDLLAKLGKHKTGKGCLYVKRLADVDPEVLEKLVKESVAHVRKTHGA